MMTQVTLHIDSKKKLTAIKTILEAMGITYVMQESVKDVNKQELALLKKAESDHTDGRLNKYESHRDILAQ